jgi:uncharacterized membrane protein
VRTLVVIAYRDETSAATAGEEAQRLVRHLGIEPDAIAVVRRDRTGRFHLTTSHHPVAGEMSWGMVWMLVFALLFAPPSSRRRHRSGPDADPDAGLGAGLGAGLDPLLEMIARSGVDERFQTEVRDRLDPGTSALFLALGAVPPDRAAATLGRFGGEVLQTTMTSAQVGALHELLHGAPAVTPLNPSLSAGRDPTRGTG